MLLPGSIVIDTSTGEPADAARFAKSLAKKGVAYLDATISGSSEQMRRGEALCMVGGDGKAFARCMIFGPPLANAHPCMWAPAAMAHGSS